MFCVVSMVCLIVTCLYLLICSLGEGSFHRGVKEQGFVTVVMQSSLGPCSTTAAAAAASGWLLLLLLNLVDRRKL